MAKTTRERILNVLNEESATRRYLYAKCGPRKEVHDALHELVKLGVIEIDYGEDEVAVLSLHPGAKE